MQKIKYICDVQPSHFAVASVVCTSARAFTDTQESHFSFAVFGIEPEEQELANHAGNLLSRMVNTEELEFFMKDERWKALF